MQGGVGCNKIKALTMIRRLLFVPFLSVPLVFMGALNAEATYKTCWTKSFPPERVINVLPALIETEQDELTFVIEFAQVYGLHDPNKRAVSCPSWNDLNHAKMGLNGLLDFMKAVQRSGWDVRYLTEKRF